MPSQRNLKMPPGYIIEVTHKSYYMYGYPPNGQSAESIMEEWFWQYPLQCSHVGRDVGLLGNMDAILEVKVVTEKEMVSTVDENFASILKYHYKKLSDLFEEIPMAKSLYAEDNYPFSNSGHIGYEGEAYAPKQRYENYKKFIENELYFRETCSKEGLENEEGQLKKKLSPNSKKGEK